MIQRTIKRVFEIIDNKTDILKNNNMNLVILIAIGSFRRKNEEIDEIVNKWENIPRYFDERIVVRNLEGDQVAFKDILLEHYSKI